MKMKHKGVRGFASRFLPGSVRHSIFLVAIWLAASTVRHVKATGDFEGIPDREIIHIKEQPINKPPAVYTPEAQADFVAHLPGFGAPTSNTFSGCDDDELTTFISYPFV
jgi:hypothetical protein